MPDFKLVLTTNRQKCCKIINGIHAMDMVLKLDAVRFCCLAKIPNRYLQIRNLAEQRRSELSE